MELSVERFDKKMEPVVIEKDEFENRDNSKKNLSLHFQTIRIPT